MNLRRLPAIAVVLVSLVVLVVLGVSRPAPMTPLFASLGAPTAPFVPKLDFVTSSWFCPGVPVGGAGLGGSVIVANPGDTVLNGTITVFTDAAGTAAIAQPFEVPLRDTKTIDLPGIQPNGSYVSALVEITGGGGFVEQTAASPAGRAVAPCANSTSNHWFFADGYTKDASTEDVVITNPFPDDAIVNFALATVEGSRSPAALQGFPVRGHSISVVKLASVVRDDAVVAVSVTSTRGRIVVARAQTYLGAARAGFTMDLGAPSLSDQYWFADGEVGPGINERYSVYNGSGDEAVVQAVFLGIDPGSGFGNDDPAQQLTIPAGGVATLSTADIKDLPTGRHGVVFSSTTSGSILVERALTRPAGNGVATTVVLGQQPRAAVQRWSMAIGSSMQLENVLVVLNADNEAATVTVKVLGPGGEQVVPGMESIALPAGAVISLGLSDPTALGHPLVVESTSRIFVERLLPRAADLRGRSGSFALPG
ncbi:MAG: DUF5719 family protein [Ilumatobacteraceae bacterium]